MKQDRSHVNDTYGLWTPMTVTWYTEVHYTTVLTSSRIQSIRKADFISPAEEFDLGPLSAASENFSVKKKHLGSVLKCRCPGGTTRSLG